MGELGEMRIARTQRTLEHTDLAVLVVDGTVGMMPEDNALLEQLKNRHIPYLIAWNKSDTAVLPEILPPDTVPVSAVTGKGITTLKEQLAARYQRQITDRKVRSIFGNWLSPEDIVVLVTPIDESAPKGRMQGQTACSHRCHAARRRGLRR